MNLISRTAFFVMAMILGANQSYAASGDLFKWVGQYSDGSPNNGKHTFLKDPQVRSIISTAMPADIFEKILKEELFSMFPVQKTGNFLTLRQCMPHACNTDTILLAIDPAKSRAVILRYTWDAESGQLGNYETDTKCYSSGYQLRDLPEAVKNEFLSHFVERDSSNKDISGLYRANRWIDKIACQQYK